MKTTIELNGVKISISATFLGFFNWDADERVFDKHPKFRVTIVSNGQRQTFTYYGSIMDYRNNVQELDEQGLCNALECRLMDASAFDNARNFEDFCAELGYERIEGYKKANKAWNGCAQAHAACQRMWGSDYHKLYNQLTEEE